MSRRNKNKKFKQTRSSGSSSGSSGIGRFPYSKKVTALYSTVHSGDYDPSRISNELESIRDDRKTHNNNPKLLEHLDEIAGLISQPADLAAEVNPLDKKCSGVLQRYQELLTESVDVATGLIPDNELERTINNAQTAFAAAKKKISGALEHAAKQDAESSLGIQYQGILQIQKIVETSLGGLETRLKGQKQGGSDGYNAQAPSPLRDTSSGRTNQKAPDPSANTKKKSDIYKGEPESVITQYGVKIEVGRREATLVFSEENLPKTVATFLKYIAVDDNIPNRNDREIVQEFLASKKGNSTILYNRSKRAGRTKFANAFSEVESIYDEKKNEKRIALGCTVTVTKGGRLALHYYI